MSAEVSCGGELEKVIAPKGTIQATHDTESLYHVSAQLPITQRIEIKARFHQAALSNRPLYDGVTRWTLSRGRGRDLEYGTPAKIIAMMRAYYRSTHARVLIHSDISQPFEIRSLVRQDCILLSILFNYASDWIPGRALHGFDGVEFAPGGRVTDLAYADDIALPASSFMTCSL
nr:unnamed protein product [Spirometra erinaceieuropaei]